MRKIFILFLVAIMPLVIAGCGSNTELDNEGNPSGSYTKAFMNGSADFSNQGIIAGNYVYTTANDFVLNANEYLLRKYVSYSDTTTANYTNLKLNRDYYNNPLEAVAGSSLIYTFNRLLPIGVYDIFAKHPSGATVRSWVNFSGNSDITLNKTSSVIPAIVETIYVKLYNDSSNIDIDTDIYHRIPAAAIAGLLSESVYSIAGDTTLKNDVSSFNPLIGSIDDLRKILKDDIATTASITSDTNKLYAVGILALKTATCAAPYIDYSVQPYIDNAHCTAALNALIKDLTALQYHTVLADSLYAYIHDTAVSGLGDDTLAANNLAIQLANICAMQSVTDTVISPFSYISAITADTFGGQLLTASKSNLISFMETLQTKSADLYFTISDSLVMTGIPVDIKDTDIQLFFYNYNTGVQTALTIDDALDGNAQLIPQCYTNIVSDANLADMFGLDDVKTGLKSAKPSLFKTFKIKSGL